PALGRHFLAPLRYEAAVFRTHISRDAEHLLGDGHLEIHVRLQETLQDPHVPVLDMAAILPQMQSDAVRPRQPPSPGALDGIGRTPAPRLADRGDVIDVDA